MSDEGFALSMRASGHDPDAIAATMARRQRQRAASIPVATVIAFAVLALVKLATARYGGGIVALVGAGLVFVMVVVAIVTILVRELRRTR
jgi:fatty acid desaturase